MGASGKLIFTSVLALTLLGCKGKSEKQSGENQVEIAEDYYTEDYRPQFHFTPPQMWMNDPNGLVYKQGEYHLFYQYYPEDIVWGPMHWGHAVSKDMVYWEHKPIALYPDEKGYIFSGSAVIDKDNTAGRGSYDNPPMVAIFTYHDNIGEKAGKNDFQTQGIAFSLDNGNSWTKYEANPVIGNDGIRDFRDPKVFWHEGSNSWIMVLVAGDHAKFYRSRDLKEWSYISEFGKEQGGHGGVWECPDLFPLEVEGSDEEKWVLIISINPNAPNGGSGTQYFIGNFDGTTFSSNQKEARWLDWGTDNYAGVTYNNVPGDERIFIGWMSNWDYARDTPTEKWRSAMTVPRELSLKKNGSSYDLHNYPLDDFGTLFNTEFTENLIVGGEKTHQFTFDHFNESELRFRTALRDFDLHLKNASGDLLVFSMNSNKKEFSIDRSGSGKVDFSEKFTQRIQRMPIDNLPEEVFEIRILIDWSSIEVFINQGQYVMTAQIFPNDFYTNLEIINHHPSDLILLDFEVSSAESIW
ncbi:MAG: glycoside hydrolase family 32 protein [Flavobacteriaceae bacterium]